jgi:hypothetical protein
MDKLVISLTSLKQLKVSLFGNKLKNECGAKIGACLKEVKEITNLSI